MQRYNRQILIKEIGIRGQEKLQCSKIAIIGCGGLGSTTIPMLAAAGVGELVIFDDDIVSISNLNRQIMFKESDIGKKKASLTKEFILNLNSAIKVKEYSQRITPNNYSELLKDIDLVVDCTDGLVTKFFLNDCCLDIGIPLIHCAVTGFEIQLLFIKKLGNPCLRCYFEVLPQNAKTCNQIGILGSTCNIAGGLAVNEAIKFLVGIDNIDGLLKIDTQQNSYNLFVVPENEDCVACGFNPIIDPTDQNSYVLRKC
jgi:sulfur carrier protein ThiS adenylyltransferase